MAAERIAADLTDASPRFGGAMRAHLHDIRTEADMPETISVADVIVEMYRRTFFDSTHADKYGTGDAARDPTIQTGLVNYLIQMGTTGTTTATPAPAPSTVQ